MNKIIFIILIILFSQNKDCYSQNDNLSENDTDLDMSIPVNWQFTDLREVGENKNEKEFKGAVLTDSSAEQPGTMTIFIYLDKDKKEYNAEDFKTEFNMLDTNLTAFSKKPKTIGGFIEYRFYIFNKTGTEQLSIRANVRKQFFEEYKNQIDGVVRSISIKRKVLENTEDGVKTEENENTKDKGSIEIYKQTEKDNK
jgi:hypothetical protein